VRLKSRITVEFEDEKTAENALTAISHEGKGLRAGASVERKGKNLEIRLDASDVVAFRAMLNSLMRDFQVIEQEE